MAEALADRLAEAFAECLHKRVRDEWGYGRDENLSNDELIEEKYRGIRPAAGYPACPDHTEKGTLWQLLDVEKNTGMQLTESFAMWPGSSVSGLYFAHPESRYFSLGKIDRDQVRRLPRRKGMTVGEVERWLGPNLNYDRDPESQDRTVSESMRSGADPVQRGDAAHACNLGDPGELAGFLLWRRYRAGGTPNARLKARLNAASDS